MKAAYINQPGPAESIVYGDLPTPQPTGSQVLVKVAAVSVNPVDTYVRSGAVAFKLPLPFIVGCDLAGTVEAVGPEATRFKPGDRVWGSNQGLLGRQGTFAEYAAVDECWLYPTPADVSDRDAAAVALVGITAHLGLFRDAKLRRGETIFVHGGSGGVGSCVVQMAKIVGARVITTAGSDEKAEICRRLGADRVVNYKSEDVECGDPPVRPERRRRVVGDAPRAGLRPGRRAPGHARAIDPDGRARRAAAVSRRAVLHQGLLGPRLRHVQRPAGRAAEMRRGDQPLACRREAAAADRPRHAALRDRRGPPAPGGEHAEGSGAVAGKIVLEP